MMKQFFKWFRVECYKLLHSSLLFIHLLIPIIGAAAMLAYYSISTWNEINKVSAYLQLLSMAFPVLVGVITSMSAEREAQAGTFQILLTAPCRKFIPHAASAAMLMLFGYLSAIIAVCGFGVLFRFMGYTGFSLTFYLQAATLLFIGCAPLYLLHYLVAFSFGKGACLGLGIVGSLLSALLLTGLGDVIWTFLPWGISIRLVTALSMTPRNLLSAFPDALKAYCFLIALSITLIVILAFWSRVWEGRKNEED